MASETSDIRRACARAKELAGWRSARIHARVRQVEDGLTPYDWVGEAAVDQAAGL